MNGVSRSIFYFNHPGVDNTDELVEIVHKRFKEGDIRSVVVASSSGATGLKLPKTMASGLNVEFLCNLPEF